MIYSTDDIKQEKLDIKYMNFLQKDGFDENEYLIIILKIMMSNPDFKVKPLTGLPQLKTTMRIKTAIRDEYKKLITDYYYDFLGFYQCFY